MHRIPLRWPRRRAWFTTLIVGATGLAVLMAWDRSESWPVERTIPGKGQPMHFRPDGRALVLSDGAVAREVDLATGAERTTPWAEWPIDRATSPDGRLWLKRLFNDPAGDSSEVRVVDAATGGEVRRLVVQLARAYCQFAPDGGSVLIFVGPEDHAQEVRTWDLATGAVTSRPLTSPLGGTLRRFQLWVPSPDGRTLAYCDTTQNGFRLWDVATD